MSKKYTHFRNIEYNCNDLLDVFDKYPTFKSGSGRFLGRARIYGKVEGKNMKIQLSSFYGEAAVWGRSSREAECNAGLVVKIAKECRRKGFTRRHNMIK